MVGSCGRGDSSGQSTCGSGIVHSERPGSMSAESKPVGEVSDSELRDFVCRGWFVEQHKASSRAFSIHDGQSLELSGVLHEDLWGSRKLLSSLALANSTIRDFLSAFGAKHEVPTLGACLRGEEWGSLFVELTGQCNESCLHCYASASPEVKDALEWEQIEMVLHEASAMNFEYVQFTGGDPLISAHLPRAIELARSLGIGEIEVYTNGLAFHESMAELFAKHAVKIALSLYSHDAEVHDRVTKTPGSHVRTTRAIRLALSKGLRIRVAGIQGCDDAQSEAKLRGYLLELGVPKDRISADRQRPVGRGNFASDVELLAQAGTQHAGERSGSGAPEKGKLCIAYTGDVIPCIFDRSVVFGNVRSSSLQSILAQALRFDSSRNRRLQLVDGALACGGCRNRRELLERSTW